ncbi:MAG: hypothetical protein K8L99_21700 [Anaerolineae bacterium]|nr:hypothetical protein [Anaerolineae bacterium]
MAAVYLEIFDGLRALYASKEGQRSFPALSAAMALSIMLELNLISLATICEFALFRSFTLVEWAISHKIILILVGIAIGCLHVVVGKRTGINVRSGPAQATGWIKLWAVYVFLTVTGFAASLILAFLARTHLEII